MNTEIFSYQKFKNSSIKNSNGDTLGDVHEVVMDLKSGQISYLILASGGFLGLGEKHLPVPFEALQYNPEENAYLMDIPKDKFENAPHIDNEGTNRVDSKYVQEVRRYYGYD